VTGPALLALDFDGVLCDGMREYFETAWRAGRRLWPASPATPPAGLFEAFARLRPLVESGWEMPVLVQALVSGVPERELARDWRPDRRLVRLGLARETVAAELDRVRDAWIAADAAGWLAAHRFYPGVVERLRGLVAGPGRVVVVTTKEGRFARQLFHGHGLSLGEGNVFGKETRRRKPAVLRALLAHERLPAAALWFVEDRLAALREAAEAPGLAGARLFLAAWGYNTPEDREATRRDERITVLPLERFAGPLAGWLAET